MYDPFPHPDGAPMSLQDKIDQKESEKSSEQSMSLARGYLKMLLSTMK